MLKNWSFETWPGVMEKLMSVNLPKSEATISEHFYQIQKNTKSTKRDQLTLEMETYCFPRREGKKLFICSYRPRKT